jgi:hypothetical protein
MYEMSLGPLAGAVFFLLGTGTGAVLCYARDRQLLRLYRDLNQQLARALQMERQRPPAAADVAAQAAATRAAAQTEVAPLAEAANTRIQRPHAS